MLNGRMANRVRGIQAPYGTDEGRGYSPRTAEYTSRGASRIDILEERLAQQEKNTKQLLDRAFKTKEDVIDSLNFTHGTWQEEKHARNMLQEHIRTITAVVNRLNADIASLEENIRSRDQATMGTNNAVKNLEVHHVATLTDLRGRIVRADTSISKLSADVRGCLDQIKQVQQHNTDGQSRLIDRIHSLESKVVGVNNQLDRMGSENKLKVQHLESDTGQQISMMDGRTRQGIDDLRNSLQQFQANADVEREKLEGRIYAALENSAKQQEQLAERLENKMGENFYVLEARIMKLEEALQEERGRLTEMQQHMEKKVVGRLDAALRQQQDEISKTKRDTRDGFSTVHESISNMKTVMEGKRKLLEDQLRKEIGQIRKMVVLV